MIDMRGIFNLWLCAIFCLSGAIASGQSVSETVSAAASSAVSDSSALASVRSAANEELSAESGGGPGSTARRVALHPAMGHARGKALKLNRLERLNPRQAFSSGELSHAGPSTTSGRTSVKRSTAMGESEYGAGGTTPGEFPDSTDGTAFPNPSDAGTVSPLEWKPGINFGLPKFSDRIFLNPTFKAGANSYRGRANQTGMLHATRSVGMKNKPSSSLILQPNDSLKSQSLGGSPLHTTVDQEILSPQ
ncbi:MAG TPA: hypothetical protein VFW25_15975 [Silvibacterium sp.]|nr:hypothetical protein [Silvibacterium sp.]